MTRSLLRVPGLRRGVSASAAWRIRARNVDTAGARLLDLSGRGNHALFGAATAAPTPLAYMPTMGRCLWLPGLVGNYVSAPDTPGLSIVGDLDLRSLILPDVWTPLPGTTQGLINKRISGTGGRSYGQVIQTSQKPRLFWSPAGTNDTTGGDSTVAYAGATGVPMWVRSTLDVDNGAAGRTVVHSTAPASSVDGIAGSTTLDTIITAGVSSIFDSATPVELGSTLGNTTNFFTGRLFKHLIVQGIAGVTRGSPDFTALTEPATSYLDAQGNLWTINRAAAGRKTVFVDRSLLVFGTDDYAETVDTADTRPGTNSFTAAAAFRRHGLPAARQTILAKKADLTTGAGYAIYVDVDGKVYGVVADGANVAVTPGVALVDGVASLAALIVDRAAQTATLAVNGVLTASVSTAAVGAATSGTALRVGALPNGSLFADLTLFEADYFPAALTAAQLAALQADALAAAA